MQELGNVKLHLVESIEEVNACLEWLSGLTTDRIGCDTETTGLDKIHDRVRLVQFGDEYDGWSIPIERWWGLAAEIVERWSRGGGRFVFHHAKFDIAHLRNHGIHIPTHLVDDTMMLAHIADPSVSIGLKQQAAKHVDARAAAMQGQLDEVMRSGGYTWKTIPITADGPCAAFWRYASLDPIITTRLWNHYAPTVLSYASKAYDLELAVSHLSDRMEQRGVCVDRPYTEEKRAELLGVYDDCTKRGHDEFGIDLGSSSQIIQRLQADKANLWKKTPGGAWSLDKEALKGVDHPLAKLVQYRKRVEKLGSTYLRRFLEGSEHDGRLHPGINTLGFKEADGGAFGVKTARMSMDSPNLQQLPRVDKSDPLSIIVRNCIVSSPGSTFLLFDMDQIEMRIMTHLTQDPGLISAFLADEDFFVALTRKVYQDPTSTKADPRRTAIKSYTYATNYGAGLDKLATTTGRPLSEMEKLDADFNATYPGVKQFHRSVQDTAMKHFREEGIAYVTSPMTGRRFQSRDTGKLYQLVNHLIQGWAAEIMKTLLLELDAAGLGDYLALVVHDEAIADVPDDMLDDAIVTMQDVMNNTNMLSLPITSGGATAKRWAEKVDL